LHIMYTIITLFVAKKATDLILDGLDPRKAVNIISSQAPVIADTIINQMNISVTVFKGYGGYLKEDTDMTYVIINKYQLMRLKKVISSIDADALLSFMMYVMFSVVVLHGMRDRDMITNVLN